MEPETLDIMEDEGLLFTDIPAMSNEGMYEPSGEVPDFPFSKNNELQDGEQEEMILDRGNEYRMVSIMRVKRANVVTSPYEIEGHALSQIDEEQHLRWTNAYPKFNDGENDAEEVKVEDHVNEENKQSQISDPGNSMSFDNNETVEIKPRLDSNRLR